MAVWSEINLRSIQKHKRLDADYYIPSDLELLRKISRNKGVKLGSICHVLNGRTPSVYTENGDMSVVRSGDLYRPLIYPECAGSFLRTPIQSNLLHLKAGDVLISSIGMGSIGKVSLVMDSQCFVTVSEVTVLRDSNIAPEFLFAYLKTNHGQRLIEREITGATGQQHLLKSKACCILVPPPPSSVLNILKRYCNEAWKHEKLAIEYERSASLLLNESLGLNKIEKRSTSCFISQFSKAKSANRLDADFFQPYFQQIFKILGKSNKTIGDVATLRKDSFKPMPNSTFDYIEIGSLRGDGSASSKIIEAENAPSRAKWIVQPGDIITSTVRPIRRLTAMIEEEQSNFVCSSGFAVLVPTKVSSELLLTFLRLPTVCELMDLYCSASMYPAISTSELLKIPFCFPKGDVAIGIKEKISYAQKTRKKASVLLKKAVNLVDDFLSEGEG